MTVGRELGQADELSQLRLLRALAEQTGQYTVEDIQTLNPTGELKLELLNGWLHLSPPPSHEHEYDIELVIRLLVPAIPQKLRFSSNFHIHGQGIKSYLIPDFAVADPSFAGGGDAIHIGGLKLAVEVTSPYNRANDTEIKLAIYRQHRVPYLLIDEAGSGRWYFLGDNWPDWAGPLRESGVAASMVRSQEWRLSNDFEEGGVG